MSRSKFFADYPDWQVPEEVWRVQQLKRCNSNNKDKDIRRTVNNELLWINNGQMFTKTKLSNKMHKRQYISQNNLEAPLSKKYKRLFSAGWSEYEKKDQRNLRNAHSFYSFCAPTRFFKGVSKAGPWTLLNKVYLQRVKSCWCCLKQIKFAPTLKTRYKRLSVVGFSDLDKVLLCLVKQKHFISNLVSYRFLIPLNSWLVLAFATAYQPQINCPERPHTCWNIWTHESNKRAC